MKNNRLDADRIAGHLKEVKDYSAKYKISMFDSFRDWLCEEPTDREVALLVAQELGLLGFKGDDRTLTCMDRNCVSIEEVNQYEREMYEN